MRTIVCLIVLSGATPAVAENLLPNAGFETVENRVPVGWTYNPEGVSLVEGGVHEGRYCRNCYWNTPALLYLLHRGPL
jgi:hypothetical protein